MPSGASASQTSSASSVVPRIAFTRFVRRVITRPLDRRRVLVDTRRGATRAPATCASSSIARSALRATRVGVDAPLEARARLAPQLEPLRAAGDAHGLEVRGLEQDLGGGVGDLGGGAAHDPGERLRRALGVGDEQVGGGELALDAVERGDDLAVGREAHDDPAATEPGEIERVQRLVALEQHVVGDVDDVADRAHPRLHEPLRHPRRRLAHRHLGHPAEVARAPVGFLDRRP